MGIDKVPTNDIPQVENENIKSSKLDWGPVLRYMSWNDAQVKITELNKDLAEGEKKWRLPTLDELLDEFKKTGKTPVGFEENYYCWSGSDYKDGPQDAYLINMWNGYLDSGGKSGPYGCIHCFR